MAGPSTDRLTDTDQQWLARALACTPNGSQTRSKAPGKVGPRDKRPGFPLYAAGGRGARLIDADGREYLDFVGANAAVPLGYWRQEVTEAVEKALFEGPLLSLPSLLEVETSEAFCAATRTERVRWVKTGSEATTAAVKLARIATGATAVVVGTHSYHGWHDWTYARFHQHLSSTAACMPNGVPSVLGQTLYGYDYGIVGDHEVEKAVEQAHRAGWRVAAIVVEPHRLLTEQRSQLREAREAADKCGAVLIFDEMVYGFRWAIGGATEYYGVRPDLACYGKALGNGVPVACVAGKAALMEKASEYISSTYGGDRLGLAAAGAVLKIHQTEPVIETLWRVGQVFFDEVAANMSGEGPVLRGVPVHWAIQWESAEEADLVLTACAQRGVLFHRDACNSSAAMTVADARHGANVLVEELTRARARADRPARPRSQI